tara:strand:+ start:13 stop:318 length:306 start_codon:yes stop_codon:yes gene_type:complete
MTIEGFNKEKAFVKARVLNADPKQPIKIKQVKILVFKIFLDLISLMKVGTKRIDRSKCSKKTTVTDENPSPSKGYLISVSSAQVTQARNIKRTPIILLFLN